MQTEATEEDVWDSLGNTQDQFQNDAQGFLRITMDIVSLEIQRHEHKLLDLRRKRAEMVALASRLGLKVP